jgi:hypothetical protein
MQKIEMKLRQEMLNDLFNRVKRNAPNYINNCIPFPSEYKHQQLFQSVASFLCQYVKPVTQLQVFLHNRLSVVVTHFIGCIIDRMLTEGANNPQLEQLRSAEVDPEGNIRNQQLMKYARKVAMSQEEKILLANK